MQIFRSNAFWFFVRIALLLALIFGPPWLEKHPSAIVAGSRPIALPVQIVALVLPLTLGLGFGWANWDLLDEDQRWLPPILRLALSLVAAIALLHMLMLPALNSGTAKCGSGRSASVMRVCQGGDQFVDSQGVSHAESEMLVSVGTSRGTFWVLYFCFAFLFTIACLYIAESTRHLVDNDDTG
jgi:hypothetical protein